MFKYFKTLLLSGLLEVRRHADELLLLVEVMTTHSRMACFSRGGAQVLAGLRDRLALDKTGMYQRREGERRERGGRERERGGREEGGREEGGREEGGREEGGREEGGREEGGREEGGREEGEERERGGREEGEMEREEYETHALFAEEQCLLLVDTLVYNAMRSWTTQSYDSYQYYTNGIL